MKRTGLLLAAVAAAAAVALLLWRRDAKDDAPARSTPTAAPEAAVAAREAPTPRALPRAPAAVAAAPQAPAAGAEPDDDVRRQLDGIARQVKRAARPCLAQRPAPAPRPADARDESLDRIRVRVKVAYAGGTAAVELVEHVAEGFVDAALQTCVLDALRAARWPTDEADGVMGLEQTLYVGDLMGVDPDNPRRDVRAAPPPPGVPPPGPPPPIMTAPPTAP